MEVVIIANAINDPTKHYIIKLCSCFYVIIWNNAATNAVCKLFISIGLQTKLIAVASSFVVL